VRPSSNPLLILFFYLDWFRFLGAKAVFLMILSFIPIYDRDTLSRFDNDEDVSFTWLINTS